MNPINIMNPIIGITSGQMPNQLNITDSGANSDKTKLFHSKDVKPQPKRVPESPQYNKALEKYKELRLPNSKPSSYQVVKNLFKLIKATEKIGEWDKMGAYAAEFEEQLKAKIENDTARGENTIDPAILLACPFYAGKADFGKGDLVSAIRKYKRALRYIGNSQQYGKYRTSFARIHRRLGDSVILLTDWENIKKEKKRVFLLTASKHFRVAAEAFSIDRHRDEWRLCIKGMVQCSRRISEIDGNEEFIMTELLDFLKRQLQRTDAIEDRVARAVLNFMLQEGCGRRVDNDAIIADTKKKKEKMRELKSEIEALVPEDPNRKSRECELATLHIEVGENLTAILTLLDTIKGVTWPTNPNLLSYSFALIGLCWLNMGDPQAALSYLRDAEYSYNTKYSQNDHKKVKEKLELAEKKCIELGVDIDKQDSSKVPDCQAPSEEMQVTEQKEQSSKKRKTSD